MSKKDHHKQAEVVYNRPGYREARWEKAVKVYTVNQESRYLLVQNVHALGVTQELLQLFSLYGTIQEYRLLDEYSSEPYTDVYWIKFVDINSARIAKKKLDNRSFFGKNLHVCYAPEYETVQDTREKLQQRRKIIAIKTRGTTDSTHHKGNDAIIGKDHTARAIETANPAGSTYEQHATQSGGFQTTMPPGGASLLPSLLPPPSSSDMIGRELESHARCCDDHESHVSLQPHATKLKANVGPNSGQNESQCKAQIEERSTSMTQQAPAENTSSTVSHCGDVSLYNPAGLSRTDRVAAFLGNRVSDSSQTEMQSMQTQQVTKKHEQRVMAVEPKQTDHRKSSVTQSESGSVQSVQPSPPLTGDRSLNASVHNIRNTMTKVMETPHSESSTKPKKKKRKRI